MNAGRKLAEIICNIVLKVTRKDLDESAVSSLTQFIKFGIVGVSNTVVSYVTNILVLFVMKPVNVSWDYFVGNIVAFLLSVLWSFYWNNKYVFTLEEGKSRSIGKALLKTYISYGFTGIILNNFLSWIWIGGIGISKYIAPIINLVVSVPINFFMNKLWAFREKKDGAADEH